MSLYIYIYIGWQIYFAPALNTSRCRRWRYGRRPGARGRWRPPRRPRRARPARPARPARMQSMRRLRAARPAAGSDAAAAASKTCVGFSRHRCVFRRRFFFLLFLVPLPLSLCLFLFTATDGSHPLLPFFPPKSRDLLFSNAFLPPFIHPPFNHSCVLLHNALHSSIIPFMNILCMFYTSSSSRHNLSTNTAGQGRRLCRGGSGCGSAARAHRIRGARRTRRQRPRATRAPARSQ
jgi:hypothetical protein